MARLTLIALCLVAAFTASSLARPDKVVCYYGSWAYYRPGDGKFSVEDIDPFKCTHAIYTFVGIGEDGGIRILDSWNDIDLGAIQRFNDMKLKNPKLKTSIAIGGWNEGSEVFSRVAASASLRQAFARNALEFMRTHGFDGFDLDWEYPGQRGGKPEDKQNVALMLAALRNVFDSSGKHYLLTAAVAAAGPSVDLSYDVPSFSQHLDFINVMAYDFHGAFDQKTGQNSPLYRSSEDQSRELNVDAAIRGWISRGAPANKLVLGMPIYGRSFSVFDTSNTGLNNPASAGNAGPFTREAGMLGYNEICVEIQNGGWTEKWDDEQKVPYMYKGNQWVGFDNERSIKLKAEYAVSMNLGGAMVWSVETDDFHGKCGRENPILSTINEVIFGSFSGDDEQTEKPVVKANECEGLNFQYRRDSTDCQVFHFCANGQKSAQFRCPSDLVFNEELFACDYSYKVKECSQQ